MNGSKNLTGANYFRITSLEVSPKSAYIIHSSGNAGKFKTLELLSFGFVSDFGFSA